MTILTDAVTTILEEVEALVASFERQRQELVDKLKPAFGSIFTPFLTKYPEVKRLTFTAYTPYFNDGEPCEYRVNELHGFLDIEDECEYEGSIGGLEEWYVLEYKRTGVVPETPQYWLKSYLKPYDTFNYSTRPPTKVTKPPRASTIEEAFEIYYHNTMKKSVEELEYSATRNKEFSELASLFSRIPDDCIRDLFGDGIKVIITVDGVEVEDYDHE